MRKTARVVTTEGLMGEIAILSHCTARNQQGHCHKQEEAHMPTHNSSERFLHLLQIEWFKGAK